MRILIIDDNEDTGQALCDSLSTLGHVCQFTRSATEALSLLPVFSPGAVMIELRLSGMSGYEVARKVREKCGAAAPLLIACSSIAVTDDIQKALEAGFVHHLTKPVHITEVTELLGIPDK